ncbi:hypothetical protein OEZ86_011079 [Tetradesmus obliquus]|nr:hypothetical protein OEZ86_011079 [Tetradesmus obliquus]
MGTEHSASAGLSPSLKLSKPLSELTADEVRAAASAALKALPAGRSTVFFVETSEESGAADEGPDTPGDSPVSKATAASRRDSPPPSHTTAANPLAGLLGGYSDDDASGGGEDSPRVRPQQREEPAQQQDEQQDLQQQEQQPEQQQPQPAKGDHMDAELASFLQELESSGLLADADADMADATQPADAAAPQQDSIAAAGEDAAAADLKAISVGLPAGWEAMWDKASGDIYYGNPTTKEVSWDRPTQ